MDFGVYIGYWQRDWTTGPDDLTAYIKRAAGLGFEVLEINSGDLLKMSDREIEALRQTAADAKITLTAGSGIGKHCDVASPDEATRRAGLDLMERAVTALEKAGIRKIAGLLYGYWPYDYSVPVDKEQAWRHSVASVREMADFAADHNVTLMLEVCNRFEHFLLNTAREAVDYVAEVGRENVKVLLDTFHMNMEEDSMGGAIRTAGAHLGHLHVGESNRKVPGKGHLPWGEIGEALNEIGYRGSVVFEPFVQGDCAVAKDVMLWRDLSEGADQAALDRDLTESLRFLKRSFGC